MPKFRKKPVVIDAFEWAGEESSSELLRWATSFGGPMSFLFHGAGTVEIPTPEGKMSASPGDWIIRGVKGEYYPCKPDIFAATYEATE